MIRVKNFGDLIGEKIKGWSDVIIPDKDDPAYSDYIEQVKTIHGLVERFNLMVSQYNSYRSDHIVTLKNEDVDSESYKQDNPRLEKISLKKFRSPNLKTTFYSAQ